VTPNTSVFSAHARRRARHAPLHCHTPVQSLDRDDVPLMPFPFWQAGGTARVTWRPRRRSPDAEPALLCSSRCRGHAVAGLCMIAERLTSASCRSVILACHQARPASLVRPAHSQGERCYNRSCPDSASNGRRAMRGTRSSRAMGEYAGDERVADRDLLLDLVLFLGLGCCWRGLAVRLLRVCRRVRAVFRQPVL
jgi:hypothetical protein